MTDHQKQEILLIIIFCAITVVGTFSLCMVMDSRITKLEKQTQFASDYQIDASNRLTKIESRFTGHRAIAAKNGSGITIEPCELGTSKGCVPDSQGIDIRDMTVIFRPHGGER